MDDQNSDQSFLSGTNATFINDLYKEWKINPNAVPKEWDLWFKSNGDEAIPVSYTHLTLPTMLWV